MHQVVTGLQEVRNSAWETIKTSDQKVEIGWDKKCFLGRWSLLSGRRSLTTSYEGWSNIEVWLYFEFDGKLFSNFVWFLFQPIISAFFVPRLFSPVCLLWKHTLAVLIIVSPWRVIPAQIMMGVIWELTWTNVVKIKTRRWNAQRWRITKRENTQAHVSWQVSWCCSTALSHFPSPNYFQTEKICEQKISYLITNGPSIRAEMRQESWRVSWSDSMPSVTFHLKIILRWKRFLQAEIYSRIYYQRQSRDCGDQVVWLISVLLAIQRDFGYIPPSPSTAEKSFSLLLEIFNFATL